MSTSNFTGNITGAVASSILNALLPFRQQPGPQQQENANSPVVQITRLINAAFPEFQADKRLSTVASTAAKTAAYADARAVALTGSHLDILGAICLFVKVAGSPFVTLDDAVAISTALSLKAISASNLDTFSA